MQLETILPTLPSLAPQHSGEVELIALCGDFNLCATWSEENAQIAGNEALCDVWDALRSEEPGWTEDTGVNLMRLNQSGKFKQVRFDRVLTIQGMAGARLEPKAIELLGRQPIAGLNEIWPSDHFGLVTHFEIA